MSGRAGRDLVAFAGRRIAGSSGVFLWLVPEQRSQFLHQLGCIGVAVRRYGVGRSRLQHFFLRARNLEGAALFTRIQAAVDRFAGVVDEAGM